MPQMQGIGCYFLSSATFMTCTASVNFCMRLYFNHYPFVTIAQELCMLAFTYFSLKECIRTILAHEASGIYNNSYVTDDPLPIRAEPNELEKYLPFFNTAISIRALAAVTLLLPCIHMFCGLKQS